MRLAATVAGFAAGSTRPPRPMTAIPPPPDAPTRAHPTGNPIALCEVCEVNQGAWPESDPRCPSCRRSGRRPGDPAPKGRSH